MKKKLGPLPAWAWLLIAAGVVGIIVYRSRSSSSSNSANAVDPNSPMGLTYGQEAADQAAGIDPLTGQTYAQEAIAGQAGDQGVGSTGGGGSGGGAPSGPSNQDVLDAVNGIETQVQTLTANGVNDNQTPTQTTTGELTDLANTIDELHKIFPGLFATPPNSTTTKQNGTKKKTKSTGSGGAASSGGNKTVRRTVTHTGTAVKSKPTIGAPPKHVSGSKRKK